MPLICRSTRTELVAEIAGAVLENMYYANVTAPEDLWVHDKVHDCVMYTDAAQDRFNTLFDIVEETIGSYLLNEEMSDVHTEDNLG